MSTRLFRGIVALATVALIAPAQDGFQFFAGRELPRGVHRSRDPTGKLPVELSQFMDAFGATYDDIKPERSLILYDCGSASPWCGQLDYQFAAVMGRVATVGKGLSSAKPSSLDLMTAWYLSARDDFAVQTLLHWNGTGQPNLQLLAIVNRMDLAQWKDGQWNGPEFRFVYGNQASDSRQMTLIVEFVLAPMKWLAFQDLGKAWAALSSTADIALAGQLHDLLNRPENLNIVKARIRSNVLQASPWALREWDLDGSTVVSPSQPLVTSFLEDQIAPGYVNAAAGTARYKAYTQLWPDITSMPPPRRIKIPPIFWAPSATYSSDDSPLPTPEKYCATEPTRNTLALERCSGCHLQETNAGFTHISNRAPGSSSTLSGFLKGSDSAVSLVDLYYADTIFPVPVTYDTYVAGSDGVCDQPFRVTTTRKFADLTRRKLFLTELLNQPAGNADPVMKYATDFSH